MSVQIRTRYGTPLYSNDNVIAQFTILRRNDEGDWKPAKVRVWVDDRDPSKLRIDGDGDICLLPGGNQSRVSVSFLNQETD